jgi:transposase-like protein
LDVSGEENDFLEFSLFNVNYVFTKGMEVEIDEAYMWWTGAEYDVAWEDVTEHEGGKWVVGIIDSGRTRLYLYCVEGRTVEDIIEVIEDVIEPGTTIHTDALNTYDALDENYSHYVINKKQEGFSKWISPAPRGWINVCVNNIEETWKDLRSLSHRRMLNRPADVPMLCIEFMYRWHELSWYDLIKA